MAIEIYLHFKGNCREAIEFYAKAFKTEIPQISTWGDVPPNSNMSFSDEANKLVMNARMNINGSIVMLSDIPVPEMPYVVGSNINMVINNENMDELKSTFNNLKEDGTVIMDLQKTFWSTCYGMVTDKFGITWHLNSMFIPFDK
jgi:PhnB protein